MTIQTFLVMAIMILFCTLQSLLCRKYSDHYPGDPDLASPVFTIFSGLIVAIISFLLCGTGIHISPLTLLLGTVNGLTLVAYNTFIIKASQTGPYSILMFFSISGAIVIPLLVAGVAFGEAPSAVQIVCILVILGSVYLVSKKDDEELVKRKSFWIACGGLALANGCYGTLLDCQQRLTGVSEKEEMVALTYTCAILLSTALLFGKAKKKVLPAMKQNKKSLFYLLGSSISIAAATHMLVGLIDKIDLSILYTFDSSSVLILSVLCSWIFFKEKLSFMNMLGCVTMCASLICMSLFG